MLALQVQFNKLYRSRLCVGRGAPLERVRDLAQHQMRQWAQVTCEKFAGVGLDALRWVRADAVTQRAERRDFAISWVEPTDSPSVGMRVDTADKDYPERRWAVEAVLTPIAGVAELDLQLFCITEGPVGGLSSLGSVPNVLRMIASDCPVNDGVADLSAEPWTIADASAVRMLFDHIVAPARRLPIVVLTDQALLDAAQLSRRLFGVARVVVLPQALTYNLTDAFGDRQWSVFGGAVRTYRAPCNPDRDDPRRHPLALASTILEYKGGPAGFAQALIERSFAAVVTDMQRFESLDTLWLRDKESGRSLPLRVSTALPRLPGLHVEPEPVPEPAVDTKVAEIVQRIGELEPDASLAASDKAEIEGLVNHLAEVVDELGLMGDRYEEEKANRAGVEAKLKETEELLAAFESENQELQEKLRRLEAAVAASSGDHGRALEFALPDDIKQPGVRALAAAFARVHHDMAQLQHDLYGALNDFVTTDRGLREARKTIALGAQQPATVPATAVEAAPDSLEPTVVADWVERRYPGKLVLHPRALGGLSEAQFESVPLVYDALDLMANEYRNMRRRSENDNAAKSLFEERLEGLHLQDTRAISESQRGIFESDYTVPYKGKQCDLERHLRNGGNARYPKRCFRLYYFWDPEDEVVVIGWLPGHLPNQLS